MQIYNMDETPCYFDMASDQTLHFKGDKNVDGIDTDHRKSRFTVTLCCCADARMVKTLIVFKGLKNVPKLNLPVDVEVTVSMGGSMNTCLLPKWIRSCFTQRGPFLAHTPLILYMDSYGSHIKEEVSESLRSHCATKVLVIPPKMTSVLQPLDVSLNSSFKAALRRGWLDWLINGPKERTGKGYRRRPSYQAVVDMVLKAVHSLLPESIRKSFRVYVIAAEGEKVLENELNERLKQLLMAPKNAGMVLNTEEASAENIIKVESCNEFDEEDELDFIQIGASDIMEGLDADDYDNSAE